MSQSIADYASLLSLSENALKRKRRQLRMENPENIEARLLAWLRATYEEHRDKVNRLAKGSGYTEFWSGSMGASQRHQLGNLHQEPESVPEAYQTLISLDARTRRAEDTERSQEHARAQLRSLNEALRERIRKGEDIGPHLARLHRDLRTEDAA